MLHGFKGKHLNRSKLQEKHTKEKQGLRNHIIPISEFFFLSFSTNANTFVLNLSRIVIHQLRANIAKLLFASRFVLIWRYRTQNNSNETAINKCGWRALMRNATYAAQTKSWMVKWSWIIRAFSHWADVSFCRALLLARMNGWAKISLVEKRSGGLTGWRRRGAEDWMLWPVIQYTMCAQSHTCAYT